jgi:hypothetical protein
MVPGVCSVVVPFPSFLVPYVPTPGIHYEPLDAGDICKSVSKSSDSLQRKTQYC